MQFTLKLLNIYIETLSVLLRVALSRTHPQPGREPTSVHVIASLGGGGLGDRDAAQITARGTRDASKHSAQEASSAFL